MFVETIKLLNNSSNHNNYVDKTIIHCNHYDLFQGCPTCGPLKVLLRSSDDFQFSGYNEDYEEEFCEIAERHLGRKSINKRRF